MSKPRKGVLRYNKETGKVEEVGVSRKVKGRAKWPMTCDASGVNPEQIEEVRADIVQHGFTGVDVNAEGQMVYETRGQRNQYLRHIGMYDRNAGYGDTAPENR